MADYPKKEYERKTFRIGCFGIKDYVMNCIDFFKLQAKNLHRDFKTKMSLPVGQGYSRQYDYKPKYFDVELVIQDFKLDHEKLTLMKAQHAMARMTGFNKWTSLIRASESELKVAKILFENQDVIDKRMWQDYIAQTERMNQSKIDSETELTICEQVFEMDIFRDIQFDCYLLDKKY